MTLLGRGGQRRDLGRLPGGGSTKLSPESGLATRGGRMLPEGQLLVQWGPNPGVS